MPRLPGRPSTRDSPAQRLKDLINALDRREIFLEDLDPELVRWLNEWIKANLDA